jgi:hypothetical protein
MPQEFPPDAELYQRIADDQGLRFRYEMYVAALTTHASMREALLRLRQEPQPYADHVWEPSSALAWLENDGPTRD